MKLSSAAIGLAAVGAGLVVARLLSRSRDQESAPVPPSPEQLIGEPQAHLSAVEAAEAFRSQSGRPQ
ncbi:MAG: hypothetical protein NVV74_12820 [Magnetospirillum sp.]|nr:hypothetical protein [Magnetospirillum sp.]